MRAVSSLSCGVSSCSAAGRWVAVPADGIRAPSRSVRTIGCFTDGHGRAALAACSGCTRAAVPGRGTSAIVIMACRPRQCCDPGGGEDGVECGGELRVPVADQVGEAAPGLLQFVGEVAGEQRAGSHDPPDTQALGHDPGQRGEDGSVGPGHTRPGVGPAQHGYFMAQHEYFQRPWPRTGPAAPARTARSPAAGKPSRQTWVPIMSVPQLQDKPEAQYSTTKAVRFGRFGQYRLSDSSDNVRRRVSSGSVRRMRALTWGGRHDSRQL
jgi:hypothetical protein